MEVVDMETGVQIGPSASPTLQSSQEAPVPPESAGTKASAGRKSSSLGPAAKGAGTGPVGGSSGLGDVPGAASGANSSWPKLQTAAELAGQPPPPNLSPDEFSHGMLVLHPQYGLGRIVALSGSGSQRQATVDFLAGAGRKKFLLHQSPLRPVQRNGSGPSR